MPAAKPAQFRANQPLGAARVDREAGLIRGVKIITLGEARGHDVSIDQTTLDQVKTCAEGFGDQGFPIKFNPGTFNHGDGGYAARAINHRFEGDSLISDLAVLKTYEHRDYFLELAETMPGTFGLSIDFQMGEQELRGQKFARCLRLDAATVVDVPAANVGLFREGKKISFDAKSPKNQPPATSEFAMTPEELTAAINAAIATALQPLTARLDKIEAANTPPDPDEVDMAALPADEKTKVEGMSADGRKGYLEARRAFRAVTPATPAAPATPVDVAKLVEQGATKALEAAAAKFTGRTPAPAAPTDGTGTKSAFGAKVAALEATGMKPAVARATAIQRFPDLYNADQAVSARFKAKEA